MATADDLSGDLVERWRTGDQGAATELFRRYTHRLVALAHSRLPGKLTHRIDPEDVVQSVYRSFFVAARNGHYDFQGSGDLWRLLVTITLHKLYKKIEWNSTRKRTVDREQSRSRIDTWHGLPLRLLAQDPTPVEAVALSDELEQVMRPLAPVEREILALRLQGHNLDEIAVEVRRCQRTVRRVLERVRRLLEERQAADSS